MNIRPSTISTILELRSKFQDISDASFAFSTLNKKFPINFIDETQGQELIKAYKDLLFKFDQVYERSKSTT